MKRLIPLALLLVCVGLMVLWHERGLGWRILQRPVTYAGVLPILAGIALHVLGLHGLVKARTTIMAFRQPARLVTAGVYRHTRNPVYLGAALILIGACILFSARCLLVPVAIFVVIVDRWIIRGEEEVLLHTFGRNYEDYCRKTPRWI